MQAEVRAPTAILYEEVITMAQNITVDQVAKAEVITVKPRLWRSRKFRDRTIQLIATLIILAGAGIVLIPLAWMFSTSLKTQNTITALPPEWIPRQSQRVDVEIDGKNQSLFLYDVIIDGEERLLAAVKLDPEQSIFVDPANPAQEYYAPSAQARKHKQTLAHWENYYQAWTFAATPFGIFMRNTAIYAVVAVIGEVLSCSLVAYGFARLRAPGKNILFVIVLGTLILPPEITLIPSFVLFTRYIPDGLNALLGTNIVLTDTWWPIMLPKFFGSAFLIFLIRQFYMGISKEYDDAARIDGCSYFRIWWNIILPMSRPVLIAVAILSFQYHWAQDYMTPLVYLSSTNKLPLTVGLANMQEAFGGTPWHLLMAGSLIAVLPLILIFFILNRYFVQGIVVSGVKG
jgi:multiple sugar transport system permease protein